MTLSAPTTPPSKPNSGYATSPEERTALGLSPLLPQQPEPDLWRGLNNTRTPAELMEPLFNDMAHDLRLLVRPVGRVSAAAQQELLLTIKTQWFEVTQTQVSVPFTAAQRLAPAHGTVAGMQALIALLPTQARHLRHNIRVRRVSILGGRLDLCVPVRVPPHTKAMAPAQPFTFPAGVACGLWRFNKDGTEAPTSFWHVFPSSFWYVMASRWLEHTVAAWLRGQGLNLSDEKLALQSLRIGRSLSQLILNHDLAVRVVVLDALGYPRALTNTCRRNTERRVGYSHTHHSELWLQRWHAATQWWGRSLKLFALSVAVPLRSSHAQQTPREVRDYYLSVGLTRGAWAHFYRLPAPILQGIAHDLLCFKTQESRTQYGAALSRLLASLGQTQRYYTVDKERLRCAILWAAREIALLHCHHLGATVSTYYGFGHATSILNDRHSSAERSGRHYETTANDAERLEPLLLSFVHHLLNSGENTLHLLTELSDVRDWYRAEGFMRSESFFSRPYTAIQQLSAVWHFTIAEQLADQALAKKKTPKKWGTPLRSFTQGGFKAEAVCSEMALVTEGRLMHHCVGSYTQRCISKAHLIYKISHNNNRLGTLELHAPKSPNGIRQWQMVQFKGKYNLDFSHLLNDPTGDLHKPYQAFLTKLCSRVW